MLHASPHALTQLAFWMIAFFGYHVNVHICCQIPLYHHAEVIGPHPNRGQCPSFVFKAIHFPYHLNILPEVYFLMVSS